MKTFNKILFTILLITSIFVLNSCEKVIEIKVKDTEKQIMVEAILSDIPNYSYVKISRNNSLYDETNFEKISNAIITITDENGNITNFTESATEAGYYTNSSFIGTQKTEYELKIDIDGKIYTSKSRMPFRTNIDSTNCFIFPSQMSGKMMIIANFYYRDSSYVGNYYRIKVFLNNQPTAASPFNLFSDDYVNGTFSAYSYNDPNLKIGDSVIFYLMNSDKANYDYFRLLYMNPGMSFSSAPGNPTSNIEGENVIGFFGAYSIGIDTLVIMPPLF